MIRFNQLCFFTCWNVPMFTWWVLVKPSFCCEARLVWLHLRQNKYFQALQKQPNQIRGAAPWGDDEVVSWGLLDPRGNDGRCARSLAVSLAHCRPHTRWLWHVCNRSVPCHMGHVFISSDRSSYSDSVLLDTYMRYSFLRFRAFLPIYKGCL